MIFLENGMHIIPHLLQVGDQRDDQCFDRPDRWNRKKDDANAVPDRCA
jgi:hypothetical protein